MTCRPTPYNNNGISAAIFSDLGTGTSYGSFTVDLTGSPPNLLSFTLNAAALAEITAAAGGFFSIGGDLLSNDGFFLGFGALFANSSGSGIQRLILDLEVSS